MNFGINYFLNQNPGTALDNFKVYFDFFSGQSLSKIENRSGDLNISGEIKYINSPVNLQEFYSKTGQAFLNSGIYIELKNITGLNLNNFTTCFIYENLRKGGSTLISSIETGIFNTFNEFGLPQSNIIFKGFEFGVTANNKLYFEYYSKNGPDIFISDFYLSNKNSIFLSINENSVIFGYYDFYKNNLISNNFIIESEFLFESENLYIGYNIKSTGLYNFNQIYTGYLSEFLIFSPLIYNYDIISINSGYAHIYNTGYSVSNITNISGVTGYSNEITGFINSVTGLISNPTGIIVDEWGVTYTGFQDIELTGLIPQFGQVPVSGVIDSITGKFITGDGLTLNYEFLNSLGKNYVNFLSKIDSDDILELNSYTGFNLLQNVQKNIFLQKELVNDKFYISDQFNFSGMPIVFANGQAHLSGNLLVTGTPYNSGLLIVNDYYYDNNFREFIFSNDYNENDSVFVDIENVDENLYILDFSVPSGVGQIVLTGWNNKPSKIYFNGQKIISGMHFEIQSNNIVFNKNNPLYDGTTGILIRFPISYNYSFLTSGINLINLNNRYLYNFTEIYKNGIRQTLHTDYLELPYLDSNTGKGFFDVKKDLIYNNGGII